MIPEDASPKLIELLAREYQILPAYVDTEGRVRETRVETRMRLLRAFGVSTESEDALRRALEDRRLSLGSRLCDPVLVVSIDRPPEHFVFTWKLDHPTPRCPPHDFRLSLGIRGEAGAEKSFSFDSHEMRLLETVNIGDRIFGRFGVPFPRVQRIGYYDLDVRAASGTGELKKNVRLIVCPEKAYLPPALQGGGRAAGLWVSLYGLRSEANWGIGDFGDLKRLIRWAAREIKVSFLGVNPLHSLFNRTPFHTSPYLPASRLYRNFVYLEIPGMPDFKDSEKARTIAQAPETLAHLRQLRTTEQVDYEGVARIKMRVLKEAFQGFLERHWGNGRPVTERARAFSRYILGEGKALDDYALFMALEGFWNDGKGSPGPWKEWPEAFQNPKSSAVMRFRLEHWKTILFHKYLQWQIEEQLREAEAVACEEGMSLGLYHDLAMGDDLSGAEVWANQGLFFTEAEVGAPPDAFSPGGQNWGFPPPQVERHRENGYALFIQELRKNFRPGGCIRIDHIMRLFHHFWILRGTSPKEGAYVGMRHEELLGILALESVRNKTLVIGEDLGTVQPYVREALDRSGIFSYRLLYFEKDAGGEFLNPSFFPDLALASITTHDLPTLCGYWKGSDIEERKALGIFDDEDAYLKALREREEDKKRFLDLMGSLGLLGEGASTEPGHYPEVSHTLQSAFIGLLALCRSKLIVLNQEDLFMDDRQQNLPGTTWERKNWCTKMRYRIEDLHDGGAVSAFARTYRDWIRKSGRAGPL